MKPYTFEEEDKLRRELANLAMKNPTAIANIKAAYESLNRFFATMRELGLVAEFVTKDTAYAIASPDNTVWKDQKIMVGLRSGFSSWLKYINNSELSQELKDYIASKG